MCTQVVRKQQQSQEKVCREAGVANLHSALTLLLARLGLVILRTGAAIPSTVQWYRVGQ